MEEIKKISTEWRKDDRKNGVCYGICSQNCADCLLGAAPITIKQYLRFCCRPIITKEKSNPS